MRLNTHASRLYGLTISSPFPLPGALHSPQAAQPCDVVVCWEPESAWREITHPIALAPTVRASLPVMGETGAGELCIQWRRELQFVIGPDNDRITVVCRPAKLEFAPTVLVGVGLGLLLYRRGVLCLHGSVASIGCRTIALLGDSGAGKSTAAAALVAHGATLISDDLVALRQIGNDFFVERGCATLRLGEAAKIRLLGAELQLASAPWVDKLLWDVSSTGSLGASEAAEPWRLDACYLLSHPADSTDAQVGGRLPPWRALRELVAAWYPQGFTSLLNQKLIDRLRDAAEHLPVHELHYPRRWEILPRLVSVLSR